MTRGPRVANSARATITAAGGVRGVRSHHTGAPNGRSFLLLPAFRAWWRFGEQEPWDLSAGICDGMRLSVSLKHRANAVRPVHLQRNLEPTNPRLHFHCHRK